MNIGIDVDDTLSNSFEEIFADSQKFDIEECGNDGNVKNVGKSINHYYIENMYNWKDEQCEKFWTKYFMKVVEKAEPKTYASEVVQKLKEDGHKIYIITSRYEDENYKYVGDGTRKWLDKHKIPYDKLVLNAQDKSKVAKEYNIDIFIDDSLAHCKSIENVGIKALLYTSFMNQVVETDNITRVYSWVQIYNFIQKIT